MASNSLALRFKLLGDASGLTKATKTAGKDLKGLGGVTKQMSGVFKGALAGLSVAALTSGLIEATKAAAEDARSMALLSKTIQNVVPKQANLTAGVEELISSMSVMAAVTDDEIRPAFANLIKGTKSVEKASKLMGIALDVSADSGISVEAASKLLSKAYNGNLTALYRLYPALKGVKNPLKALEKQVKGMANIKGDNDPFGRMTIMANEAKEEIGKVLLPEIKKLAKYLQSPEGKRMIQQTTNALKDLVKEGLKIAKWAVDNKGTLAAIGGVLLSLKVTTGVISSYKTLKTIWEGLVKAGKLIKPPAVGTGGVGLPQGPVKPGGKTPTVVGGKTPTGSKLTTGLKSLVTLPNLIAGAGAAIVAIKAESYQGVNGAKNAAADIKRATDEYGKYYSATELLLATGKKKVADISAGGSNMAPVTSKDTYNIKIEGSKLTPEQIVALLRKYSSKRGRSAGRFIDLG